MTGFSIIIFSIISFSIINVWGSTCWTCHGSTIQTRFLWGYGNMYANACSINPNGRVYMYIPVYMILCISMASFRGIYQIFRHIFSIIQYSPLKCIKIANRWTYSHRQNYGQKNIMENIIMESKKVRNVSIIDRRRL